MPCLFSATHWYIPESDRFNAAIERAPFSICTRPCGGKRNSSAYPLQGRSIMSKKHRGNYWCTMKGGGQRERRKEKKKKSLKSLVAFYVCSACNGGGEMRRQWRKLLTCILDTQKRSNVDNSTGSILKSHLFSVVAQLEKLCWQLGWWLRVIFNPLSESESLAAAGGGAPYSAVLIIDMYRKLELSKIHATKTCYHFFLFRRARALHFFHTH